MQNTGSWPVRDVFSSLSNGKSYFQTLKLNHNPSLLDRNYIQTSLPTNTHKHTHHHWEGQADDVDGPDRAEAGQNSPYEIIIGFGSVSSSVSGCAGLSSERWSRWPRNTQWPGAAAQPGTPVRMCVVGFDMLLTRRRRSGRTAVNRSRANTITWCDCKRKKHVRKWDNGRIHTPAFKWFYCLFLNAPTSQFVLAEGSCIWLIYLLRKTDKKRQWGRVQNLRRKGSESRVRL